MFYNLSSSALIFIIVGSLCMYFLVIGIVYGKKLFTNFGKFFGLPVVQASASAPVGETSWPSQDPLPPLIDKPADHPAEQAGIYESESDEAEFEIAEDEGTTTLLKEAERVVEKIQQVVNNIASRPANPEEVYSKIRAIVSEYRIFIDTEYFDAINSFIAVTVERDCELSLAEDDLKTLWYAQAA